VSAKDRGVGIREQVLNVPIACGDMGPVSLAHYFNGCVGRETGAGPTDRSAGLRGGVESTFSQEQ
jgi:hypothetical protein